MIYILLIFYFIGSVPLGVLVSLIEDFLDDALDRIGNDIEDIVDTLDTFVDFMVDLLAGQAFDSRVDLSHLLATKEKCGRNPTVNCYLRSIFKHVNVNTSVLGALPDCIGNYLLSPEITSSLWSNVHSRSLTFGDCLRSFLEALLKPSFIGSY